MHTSDNRSRIVLLKSVYCVSFFEALRRLSLGRRRHKCTLPTHSSRTLILPSIFSSRIFYFCTCGIHTRLHCSALFPQLNALRSKADGDAAVAQAVLRQWDVLNSDLLDMVRVILFLANHYATNFYQ